MCLLAAPPPAHTIGSVLPWPVGGAPAADSIWTAWTAGYRNAAAYGSARSALAALLRWHRVARLWLPAYCCPALVEAAGACEVMWYGVDATLAPMLHPLAQSLRPGDAVIGIDYFGRSQAAAFAPLVAERPDVLWIEDRAQALAPGPDAFGDVLLFSPRKLIGVSDGGLIVSDRALPTPAGPPRSAAREAQIARAADPAGLDPAAWFPQFQRQEAAFHVDDAPMDGATREALASIALAPLITRRRANAALLAAGLQDVALWPGDGLDFAPLAFPVRVQDSAGLAATLARAGIYCARHWPHLPSDPACFPVAHRLAGELLSLPCDHRYGAADMQRVVAAVRAGGATGP